MPVRRMLRAQLECEEAWTKWQQKENAGWCWIWWGPWRSLQKRASEVILPIANVSTECGVWSRAKVIFLLSEMPNDSLSYLFLTKHEAMRVAAQTTRDGIRQYSHCEYVLSRSLPHCKNYMFGHVGLLSSLFSITVQELPKKNVYDHIERLFLHMRTIFTDNIRYYLIFCMKALMCIVRIHGHIDKLFFCWQLTQESNAGTWH